MSLSVLCWGVYSFPSWLEQLFWWFGAFMFNRLDFSHSWVISGRNTLSLNVSISPCSSQLHRCERDASIAPSRRRWRMTVSMMRPHRKTNKMQLYEEEERAPQKESSGSHRATHLSYSSAKWVLVNSFDSCEQRELACGSSPYPR